MSVTPSPAARLARVAAELEAIGVRRDDTLPLGIGYHVWPHTTGLGLIGQYAERFGRNPVTFRPHAPGDLYFAVEAQS